jgi:hypothetical protein
MPGISPGLHKNIRDELLKCDPLKDSAVLENIFNDPRLDTWLYTYPRKGTPLNQVTAIINFLLPKEGGDEQNALALFMRVLSEYLGPKSVRGQELAKLANDLEVGLHHDALASALQDACFKLILEGRLQNTFSHPLLDPWELDRFIARAHGREQCDVDGLINALSGKQTPDGKPALTTLFRVLSENVDARKYPITRQSLEDMIPELEQKLGSLPDEETAQPVETKPPPESYTELEIYISASDVEGSYNVKAELNQDATFNGTFDLGEIKSLLADAELDAGNYGAILFDTLFRKRIRGAYDQALAYAQTQTDGRVRFRLWIANAVSELHALIWERLHTEVSPLTIAAKSPFSRYISLETSKPDPISTEPIRILFAIANPENLTRYNLSPVAIETEVNNMLDVLAAHPLADHLQITLMPGRTGLTGDLRMAWELEGGQILDDLPTSLDNLIQELSRGEGYHILHYLGHGTLQRGHAGLLMEDARGQTRPIKDQLIASRLSAVDSLPHLIFLAACDSAKRVPGNPNPFVGLAPRLIQVGIPAIVAMQDKIAIPTARKLTKYFYEKLLDYGIVDKALNQARSFIYESNSTEWSIPVLFMQLKDGVLFDIN